MEAAHAEGRNAFEIGTMLAMGVTGLGHMVLRHQPSVIGQAMGFRFGLAWALLLFVGAAATLTGVWWRGSVATALQLEQTGLAASLFAVLAAVAAILATTPLSLSLAAPVMLGVGAAMTARLFHIRRAFRRAVNVKRRLDAR